MQRIAARVRATHSTLVARPSLINSGFVVPAAGDLPIGKGRRLEASILFLDICGFSNRPLEDVDEQAETLGILTLLFSEFIRIIEDKGGTVEKNTGDGLMAYFTGKDNLGVNHQSRAVEAALYMFYAARQQIDPLLQQAGIQPVDFRITINSGQVTVADVGAKGRFRGIVAIGTAANVASKMLARAGRNEILIGAHTLKELRTDWVRFASFHSNCDQFFYRVDGTPYSYYLYSGRFI